MKREDSKKPLKGRTGYQEIKTMTPIMVQNHNMF